MDVSHISPSNYMYSSRGIFPRALRYAPLTLTTLANSVYDADPQANVRIIDEGLADCPTDLDSDVVAISAITGTAERSYAIADHYMKKGKKVILGGVHPTLLPEEAKKHADSVVVGYGHEAFYQALNGIQSGNLRDFYHDLSPNLNKLKPARRDLLKRFSYITKGSMQVTYGCENSCDFCVIPPTQGRHKMRCLDGVIEEMAGINSPFISIVDPNLTENPEYAKELFRRMKPLGKKWGGLGTVEVGEDPELLDLMADSGCKGILIGFESVNPESNKVMNKGVNDVRRYEGVVQNVHDRGIAINGTFLFGSDADDSSAFEETVDFVNSVGIDLPRFSVSTPFPGTRLFSRLKKEGRLTESSWPLFDGQHVVFDPAKMDSEELREGLINAWEKTYSLGSITRRLKKSGCSPAITGITNLGYRYYANRLRKFDNETVLRLEEERNAPFK